jgi:hypothetical protein
MEEIIFEAILCFAFFSSTDAKYFLLGKEFVQCKFEKFQVKQK